MTSSVGTITASAALAGVGASEARATGTITAGAEAAGYTHNPTYRIEKTFTPGVAGIPSDPGQPWIPAYTSTRTVYTCGQVPIYDTITVTHSANTGPPNYESYTYTTQELIVVGYREECGYQTYITHHPEQPYIPPTPGTPDIPPDFRLGWRDGARSGPYGGNLTYVFKAHPGIVGVVTGLTPARKDRGYGYLEIDYGLHFGGGFVRVLEAGTARTGLWPYQFDDVFVIERRGKFITYRKNSEILFESVMPAVDLSGPVVVDLSMYSGGDSLWDAQVTEAPLDGYGAGDAWLPPLLGFGADYDLNYGDAELPALAATGAGHGLNSGDAYLPALHALGGDHAVGMGDAYLPALESYGEAGLMAPGPPNYGDAWLPSLMAGGLLLVGGVGEGDATLPRLHALGGDHHFGQAVDQELPPPTAVGYQIGNPLGLGTAEMFGPTTEVEAVGIIRPLGTAEMYGPTTEVEAWGASVAEMFGPTTEVAAVGVIPIAGTAEMYGPTTEVAAVGVVGIVGRAEMHGPTTEVEAWGASVAEMYGPTTEMEAVGLIGLVGRADMYGPTTEVAAVGVIPIAGTAEMYGPTTEIEAWGGEPSTGVVEMYGPGVYLIAHGTIGGASAPVTFAVNVRAAEVTRYEGLTFEAFLRLGGKHYGLAADGLYLLEGDSDAGEAIEAFVLPHPTDFGTQKRKRTPYIYLGTEDPATVTAYVDGGTVGEFSGYHGSRRVQLPRGPQGRYWAYKVANVAGGDLRLDGYEPQVEVLSRKV